MNSFGNRPDIINMNHEGSTAVFRFMPTHFTPNFCLQSKQSRMSFEIQKYLTHHEFIIDLEHLIPA